MALIRNDDPFGELTDAKCFACQRNADIYWSEKGNHICFCTKCTKDILPKMLADAFFSSGGVETMSEVANALEEIKIIFERSVLHNILKKKLLKKKKKKKKQ